MRKNLAEVAAIDSLIEPKQANASPVPELLVLVADCLCRILPLAGGELRLGIALSLLGAPFFLHLLLRLRRELV